MEIRKNQIRSIIITILVTVPLLIFPQEKKFVIPHLWDTIIHNNGFIICYDLQENRTHWTSYYLTKERMKGSVKRCNCFQDDPRIKGNRLFNPGHIYKNVDRGHLTPADHMRFSVQAQKESFYYTNILLEDRELNRNQWKKLEELPGAILKNYDTVFVITGAENLQKGLFYSWYKVIITKNDTSCFIIPNINCQGKYQDFKSSFQKVLNLLK